ncbi:hypothetical protein PAMA_016842 [Pampus argenteus]
MKGSLKADGRRSMSGNRPRYRADMTTMMAERSRAKQPLVRKTFPDRRRFNKQESVRVLTVQKNSIICKSSHREKLAPNCDIFTFSFAVALQSFRQRLQGPTVKLISRGAFGFHGVLTAMLVEATVPVASPALPPFLLLLLLLSEFFIH